MHPVRHQSPDHGRRARSRKRWLAVLAAVLALPLSMAQTPSAGLEYGAVTETEPDEPYVFARVRYEEGGLKIRRDQGYEEFAGRNGPIYVGDTVQTSQDERAELQLPDGTLLRLDHGTSLRFYDIKDPAGRSSNRTVVGLEWGRFQADIPDPDAGEGFRVDTPAASVYPLERSALRVDIEPDQITRVTVEQGRAEVAGQGGSVILRAGERTRVRAGGTPLRPWDVIANLRDGFGLWVAKRDDAYRLRSVPGQEYAALPEEVRPYYGELSRNGSWEWSDEYGWVWDPDVDDNWAPYVDGTWSVGAYGPVWIGAEPWGWPVYRYGRWQWRVGFGWSWIPGWSFAGAHVDWYYGPSYVGWCPIGYYDSPVYISVGFTWGDPWFDHHPWVFAGYDDFYYYGRGYRYGHRGRYFYHGAGAARLVRPDFDRGVISRRAVVTRPPGSGGHRSGSAVRSKVLGRSTYETARRLARQRVAGVREVAAAKNLDGNERRAVRGAGNRARVAGRGERQRAVAGDTGRAAARSDEARRRRSAGGARGSSGRARDDRPVIRIRRSEGAAADRAATRRVEGKVRSAPGVRRKGPGARERSSGAGSRDSSKRRSVAPAPTAPRRDVSRDRSRRDGASSGHGPTTRTSPRRDAKSEEGVRRFFGRISGSEGSRSTSPARGYPRRSTATKGREARPAPSRDSATGARRDSPRQPSGKGSSRSGTRDRRRRESARPAPPSPRSASPAPPPRTHRAPKAPSRSSRSGAATRSSRPRQSRPAPSRAGSSSRSRSRSSGASRSGSSRGGSRSTHSRSSRSRSGSGSRSRSSRR